MAENGRFTLFVDWRRDLLSRRQLTKQDGRALYLYRLTEAEFNDLENLLREWLSKLLSRFGLARLTQLSGFSGLFVLYASEWWRRRFDGSQWSWEPILHDIGANPDEWNQAQRSECVRLGLQEWGLRPRENGGLRFLGTVAVQGGLPLRLLAQARGGIGLLLSQVLKQAGNSSVTLSDLLTWVESLQGTLPKSYRQAAIFTLLADVAWTVLRLKEEAKLTSSSDAISRLDQQVKGWRDRFPLPIEDDHARGLIEQLVRDAANVRIERNAVCLPLERRLESDEDGVWTLRSTLTLPDSIQVNKLAKVFDVSSEDLPRSAELAMTVGNQRLVTTIRRMAGQDSYRIDRKPWGYSGETASNEHVLHLSAPDGRVWSINAPKGEALDEELPWVFSTEDTSTRFLRQGSGGVAPVEALVSLPAGWSIRPHEGSEVAVDGRLDLPDRLIFRVRGVVEAHNNEGLSCRIRTGQASSAEDSYEWRGVRYWLDFQNPNMAFKGLPSLYRVSQDGSVHKVDGYPGWSTIGATAPSVAQPIGPISARYPAVGEIKQRARLVVLPKDAALSMEFRDAVSGAIKLENWGATTARVLSDGVRLESRKENNVLTLSLSVPLGERTPERIEVEVFWPHTTAPARLILPFPAKGVRAFDSDGEELYAGAPLAAQQLAGVRLLVLGGHQNTRMTLEMRTKNGKPVRVHQLCALPGALSVEVRLQDYTTDIQHLLSSDDSPDANVRVILRIGGVQNFKLDVARYAAKLDKNGSDISLDATGCKMLTPVETSKLPVLALRLERPGDEAIPLKYCTTEGVPNGLWAFASDTREAGSWIIYPGPDAELPFRPTLWTIPGMVESETQLTRAIGIPNQSEREAALDKVIDEMAADFLDPCWIEIERLAGQVGHLPLATLDLWRRFARSPTGMAALALRFCSLPSGFLDRFAQELPFAWEAVPFIAWKQAMECLQRQCIGSFGDEAGALIFRTHLDSRIKDTTATHGALHFLLGIASTGYSPETKQQIQALRYFGNTAALQLFDGEESLLMRLRRLHADDEWPTGFNPILVQTHSQPDVAGFMNSEKLGFSDGAINMPLLLAAQAATSQTGNWFADPATIHVLRAHRAFDPEWFDEAYNLTVARCLAAGLLDS